MKRLVRRYRAASLRVRVAASAFVLGVLLVVLVVRTIVITNEAGLRRQFDDRMTTMVGSVAAMSADPVLMDSFDGLTEALSRLSVEDDVRTIDLRDIGGRVVASSDPQRIGLMGDAVHFEADSTHRSVDAAVQAGGNIIGSVHLDLDESAVDRLLTVERRSGLVSGLIGVMIAALISLAGAWALTRRVTKLEAQIRRVDHTGLPLPVHVEGNDEIARLGAALNQRTARLRDEWKANAEARRELELSETKLQLALTAAADAVIEADLANGDFSIVGSSLTSPELRHLGTSDVDYLRTLLHPDDRALIRQVMERTLAQQETTAEVGEAEIRVRDHERGWTHLLLRMHPVLNADASPSTRMLMALVDVTEQRATERHLARVDKMHTVGQLTAGIAHDFNNALAVARLQLSVLRRPDRDRARDDERIQQLVETNNDATEMVRRLLNSVAPQQPTPTRVCLGAFLESRLGLLRTIAGRDVTVRLDSTADDCVVSIDEGAFQQLFLNLAKNAADAMNGVGDITVKVVNVDSTSIAVHFLDTGPGIDTAVADTLFDPFVTTKPFGVGTGLGLTMAYETVVAAGGSISASNDSAGGACFTIVLPRADAAAEQHAFIDSSESTDDDWAATGQRILVVDDNVVLLGGLTDLLWDAGYHVSSATSVGDALKLAADFSEVDLLLTDIRLPDGNGFDLRHAAVAANPECRTMFMTGFISPEAAAAQASGDLFVRKPFEDEAVLAAVAAALQGAPN